MNLQHITTTSPTRNGVSVTGRDGYIIFQALAYAPLVIEALPEEWQERSDADDMYGLLRALADDPDFYLH
jgi:hypothetical protein